MSAVPNPAHIQVLLATRDGDRFLHEQVESILNQDYPALTILVRDDGSTDQTSAILAGYAARLPNQFNLLPDRTPSGSASANFSRLLEASTGPYVALADQDDVWLPDKLTRSMAAMHRLEAAHGPDTPLLVFSDLRVVDRALKLRQPSFWSHQGIESSFIHKLPRLLTQNVLTGCTALLNRQLCRLAAPVPPEAFMHDWWIALVAAAFGSAAILSEPTVLYRQHEANVIGAADHGTARLLPRPGFHTLRRRQWESTVRQAQALLRLHGARLSPARRGLVEAYLRCESSPSRLTRVTTLLRHGFLLKELRPNLAMLWYLWDMDRAKRGDA